MLFRSLGIFQFIVWIPVLSVLLSREHSRRDERLAVTQSRYRTLIESAPEAIVVLDLGLGRFVEHNQKAVDMTSCSGILNSARNTFVQSSRLPPPRRSASTCARCLRRARIV